LKIREAIASDLEQWVVLRRALWPTHAIEDLAAEAEAMLESRDEVCFLATTESLEIVGLLEGAIYAGPAGPYGHVEGWYIVPEVRRRGYGKELVGRFEQWCLHRAICLLTSDTDPTYAISPAAHAGCGFRQIAELKIFMMELQSPESGDADTPYV